MRALCIAGAGLCGLAVSAQATDLIISEYVEGSSYNKYIELYNGTLAPINLGDYQLQLFSSHSTTPSTTTNLSGTLGIGNTVVYQHASEAVYTGTGIDASAVNFNGDDAIALYKVSTTSYVDIFGNFDCDPGSAWTSTSNSTLNRTLVRNANICTGVTTDPANPMATCPFPTLESQWTQYSQDDVSHLGSHTMTCGATVNFSAPTSSALEASGTATVTMTLNPAPLVAGTVTITINGTGTATYGAANDYTTTPAGPTTFTVNVLANATSASFDINLIDDISTEADETIDFTITGTTGGIALGANLNHTFTIQNDDVTTTVNFSTLNITVLEDPGGLQIFTLSRSNTSGILDITITISGTSTATYGILPDDYTANGFMSDGSSGTFTVRFFDLQSTAFFTATVNNDSEIEPTEDVLFTITAVPGGVVGSNSSATLVIGDDDSPAAVLNPGDLVVVGSNSNLYDCLGTSIDEISFFSFKEITYNTEIVLTDNGYERCSAGTWGDSEGFIRMIRKGPAIPAGQVITLHAPPGVGPTTVPVFVAPDNNWVCTNYGPNPFNLNSGGDQFFFAQGGTWTDPAGNHNATYDGTILFAFSTNPTDPWSASCGSDGTQRSNLPPGVECFSMAPTSASDYNKYTGPTDYADQRDWIIRIDNTAHWSSYPDCDEYNTNGYNWLSAPIMNISPGAMTHGLWRGAVNTDWFECKNWDDARLPDVTTNVVIDGQASRACNVGLVGGLQPGGTAYCASLWHHFGVSGPTWALTVEPNSTLNVNGLYKIENDYSGPLTVAVGANATLNVDSLEIFGSASNAANATVLVNATGSLLNDTGDVTIGAGGRLNLQAGVGNSGTLQLGGDFINQEPETMFWDNNSSVVLNGSGDQYILNSNPGEYFYNLHVNKPGGDVYLTAPITIRKTLDLTQGRVFSSAIALPTISGPASVINASDASFVHGPVEKVGYSDFIFPVGKGNSYRPASILNIGGTPPAGFMAEYFAIDPSVAVGPLMAPTSLHHISHCEYWTIDRTSGLANAQVALTWDTPESCGVTTGLLADLRVARWNGSNWEDHGNGGTTGNSVAGEVLTAGIETAFSPWTLASISQGNPLPIELLSFTATPAGHEVDLRWATASEKDNDHFTVERSTDALQFEGILEVPGAGNSQSVVYYADVDRAPLNGLSYYRLRQTDINGTTTVSEAVPVFFKGNGKQPLTVLYGDNGIFLLHGFAPGSTLDVLDLTGRTVASSPITGEGLAQVPTAGLAHGLYVLRLSDADRVESTQIAF